MIGTRGCIVRRRTCFLLFFSVWIFSRFNIHRAYRLIEIESIRSVPFPIHNFFSLHFSFTSSNIWMRNPVSRVRQDIILLPIRFSHIVVVVVSVAVVFLRTFCVGCMGCRCCCAIDAIIRNCKINLWQGASRNTFDACVLLHTTGDCTEYIQNVH